MKYICWLYIYKKRSLESSETPVLYRGRTVPKGWNILVWYCLHKVGWIDIFSLGIFRQCVAKPTETVTKMTCELIKASFVVRRCAPLKAQCCVSFICPHFSTILNKAFCSYCSAQDCRLSEYSLSRGSAILHSSSYHCTAIIILTVNEPIASCYEH